MIIGVSDDQRTATKAGLCNAKVSIISTLMGNDLNKGFGTKSVDIFHKFKVQLDIIADIL